MARSSDKRVRLLEAAKNLIHKQGFNLSTLADIAKAANVPLGNVYYYFKTKESIAEAVIAHRAQELHAALQTFEKAENVKERLLAYVQYEMDNVNHIVKSGCPIGSLCQELAKQDDLLAISARKLLNDRLLWVEKQFQAMGIGQASHELAVQFVAKIQGHSLLAHTFKNPEIIEQLKPIVNTWLDKVICTKNASMPIEKIEEYA